MKKAFGLLVFTLCTLLNLSAQEGALIYHAQGADFALSLRGERTIYTAESAGSGGINLERSGIVNTGAGSFLEIQLIPYGTVIKLSENTSLVYNGIDGNGNFADFRLLYGRIRIVTRQAGSSAAGSVRLNSIVVRAGEVSARLEEGDLAFDYMLEPDSRNLAPRPLFRLHAFRGRAEVFSYTEGGSAVSFGTAQSLGAAEGESLFLDITGSHSFAERKALDIDAVDYWRFYNFAGSPPIPMPDTSIAAAADRPQRLDLTETDSVYTRPAAELVFVSDDSLRIAQEAFFNNRNRRKNIILSIGLSLTFSSAAVQGIAHFRPEVFSNDNARTVSSIMYAPLGLGMIITLAGILYNPSFPPKSSSQ